MKKLTALWMIVMIGTLSVQAMSLSTMRRNVRFLTDRTIEVSNVHEATILILRQNPTQVVITDIQEVVVVVQRVVVTQHYLVHDVIYIIYEIEINFIYIIVLL